MWKHSTYRAMEKMSGKFYQETLNIVQFLVDFCGHKMKTSQCIINIWCRLLAVSLFSVVRRAKRETRKWPCVWLMAREGRDNSFSSRAAALVSRVSRLRRPRARAFPLLNRKKKRDCSQSVYDEKTETHTSYLSLLKLELDNALQEFKRSINPQFVLGAWIGTTVKPRFTDTRA